MTNPDARPHTTERTAWDEVHQDWLHGCTLCGRIRRVPVELTGLSRALQAQARQAREQAP